MMVFSFSIFTYLVAFPMYHRYVAGDTLSNWQYVAVTLISSLTLFISNLTEGIFFMAGSLLPQSTCFF